MSDDAPAGGKKNAVELVKEASGFLRGTLAETLRAEATHFSHDEYQLLKFHGIYQQDDRDRRSALTRAGQEPAYMFMVRLKLPGGTLTADQYLVCDTLATKYANQTLRITSRQDFQLHGVVKRNLAATIREINACLVTTLGACGDVERNVMACPSPATDREAVWVQRYARQISDQLLPRTRAYHEIWLNGERVLSTERSEEPLYGAGYLPRKFKTGIAFPHDNCIDVYTQDIGVIPIVDDGRLTGFNVAVGGGLGMTHGKADTFPRLADLMACVPPGDLVKVCEAILRVQRDHGNRADRKRARMKYLVEEWGVARFRAAVEERLGRRLVDPVAMPAFTVEDHLGWQDHGNGEWTLGVSVENGRIQDTGVHRMKTGLRRAVEALRCELRLTPLQDLLFVRIPEAKRKLLETILRDHGIQAAHEIPNVQRYAMACPALPTCGLAITESERALPAFVDGLARELATLGLSAERFMIRMTGCPNGCVRPYMGELGFVGRTPGTFNIYVGGNFACTRLNALYAERVPQAQLLETVLPLFVQFKQARRPGEGFGDFCHRIGVDGLRAIAQRTPQP